MQQDLPSLQPEPVRFAARLLTIVVDYKCADSVNELVTETETSLLA